MTTSPNAAAERTATIESADFVTDPVITREAHAELADQLASEAGAFDVTDYLVAQELIVAALASR